LLSEKRKEKEELKNVKGENVKSSKNVDRKGGGRGGGGKKRAQKTSMRFYLTG
jgi:hypothetical protein